MKFNLRVLLVGILIYLSVELLRKVFAIPEAFSSAVSLLVLTVSVGIIFSKMVIRPLKKLNRGFASLSNEGAKELTLQMDVKSEDEWGELASGFNRVIAIFRETIPRIKKVGDKLGSSSKGLSNSIQQINVSAQQISSSIQQISKGAATQAAQAARVNQAMQSILEAGKQVGINTEAITTSSQQVLKSAQISKEFIQQPASRINEVFKIIRESANKVRSLEESSQAISVVIETVTAVADQTNLLSLNAAIEAARAGEAGRGFSVVAEEIRKLAENSANSAKRIKGLIQKIQFEIAEVISSTEKGSEEVSEGKKMVDKVKVAQDEVAKLIQQVTAMIGIISEVNQQQRDSVKRVSKDIEEIVSISQESASVTQEVSSSVEEQTASLEELASRARELSQMAQELKDLTVGFKL